MNNIDSCALAYLRAYGYNEFAMEKYLISVIIPVYNGSDFVAKAIESAINQTYKNLEIIVINDGSTDNGLTKKAVEPYLLDNRVTYIEKENGGVSSVLNYGISHFKGDFFVWLSHDDMFAPNSLELRVNKWIKLGEDKKVIISTDTRYIDKNGNKKFRIAAGSKDINNIYDILSSTINGCSLLIPRSVIEGHKFIEGMIYMPDYYLWATFINEGVKIRLLKKKITYNRVHDKQITSTRMDLLERDFGFFDKEFVMPLFDKKEYKQLRKIVYAFTRRLSVRPFYKSYVEKYKTTLKMHKKWCFLNSIHLFFDKMVCFAVKILRKIK